MKPSTPFTVAALLSVAVASGLAGCDDHPTAVADTGAPAASAPHAATPSATAAATAPEAKPAEAPKKPRGPCTHEPFVTFDDPEMERVVRRQLQQPTGPIARSALRSIKTFNVSQAKLDDVDPCLFADLTGVKELYLPPGLIRDLSPIKPLVHLEGLGIAKTAVTDLSPISAMAHMDRLDISHTAVADLSAVAPLVLLTELTIDDTPIKDLTPLAKMSKLEMLSIQNTPVESLAPLHGLTHLKKLYIAGSLVKDISMVQGIQGLKIFQQGR